MAVNFSLCVILVLYQLCVIRGDEASSESADLGMNEARTEDVEGVRCYCNTAQCVSTGYMCRAPRGGGGCYSEVPTRRRAHHTRHGCLHHLAETEQEAQARCQNSPGGRRPAHDHSLLLCCSTDLCNHEDSPIARARLNMSLVEETPAVASERGVNCNGEVWLKAATIVVPVCGALILFLLGALAVRWLKTSANTHTHADRKLRGGYMTPLAQHTSEDVKKVYVGNPSTSLILAPGGCLVAVERAQLVATPCQPLCDIKR